MSNSLWPHGLQHNRLPCPSPSPGACSKSCLLSQQCHPTNSSSIGLFSSCPQSFPASRYFPKSWLFASGGQSIGATGSASVLPMNIQSWFPLGLTGLIFLLPKHQSRFDAGYRMLGASALGRPRGMVWGGRREEGSGWGTHVYLWRIHFDIWQN